MNPAELKATAREMIARGKGILAADESSGTIKKRFDAIGLDSTPANRRAYREMLFSATGLGECISAVILFDETLRQAADDGTSFPELLARRGIVPGIKVDRGTHPLAGFPGETVTEGLDGLRERLAEYRNLGARFAKWRAVLHVGNGIPTLPGIEANAHALARYATLSQEAGLVPIVEPEVLMDGDHSIDRCEAVTAEVLNSVFSQLFASRVFLEGLVLKPNMVVAGTDCPEQPTPQRVAEATVRCMRRQVPAAVPGIAFLSGGQTEQQASYHLDLINRQTAETGGAPWELSFSFGRALQHTALRTWAGSAANVPPAQAALLERARLNGLARRGQYEPGYEPATTAPTST
jgi:fructose-bisphosphate aldolase class I